MPTFDLECADCLEWLERQPDDSVDLVFGSPPYEQARDYLEGGKNLSIARKTDDWVTWMVKVWGQCQRISKGLVAFVVEGQTRDFRYSAGPLLLGAALVQYGFNLRKPPIFHRIGIAGSGGPDWLRNDYEFVITTTKPGKLPWSDNTAAGHPPKWAPGGAMSHRITNGARVNQWGKPGSAKGMGNRKEGGAIENGSRPSHEVVTKAELDDGMVDLFGDADSPSLIDYLERPQGTATCGNAEGDVKTERKAYDPPALANPGNVFKGRYTHDEVLAIVGRMMRDFGIPEEHPDIVKHLVGGGLMGHPLAHDNEAPFPLSLAEDYVLTFCPPDGIVCDVFSGSGTTAHAAIENGRNFRGCDLRESQVDLARRRLASVTPGMF